MTFKAIKARLSSGLKGIKGRSDGGGAVMAQGIPRRGKVDMVRVEVSRVALKEGWHW
jgi:hypothetical protein